MSIELNDDQATAILTEGLSRGVYENQGKVPDDPKVRLEDAIKLTEAALAASRSGNKSENVNTILFIAQVDQQPLALNPAEQKIAENVVAGNTIISEKKESVSTNIHNGLDLTSLSDGVIDGLITGLDKYPPSEQVEADRKAFVGERERRKNAQAQKGQEDSQAEAPGEAVEKPSQIADEGSAAIPAVGRQDAGARADNSAEGEDAGAFARAQTPETVQQGKQTKAKPVEEDGERTALIEQLTLPAIKAHGISPIDLDNLSTDQIKYILDNPDGPTKEDKMPVDEKEVEASAVGSEKERASVVGGIDINAVAKEKVISKADLGIEVEEDSSRDMSNDRENLESLVTGPMLKAYARGRKEIPSIGDNELRFMVLNPDGKVTPEELEKARQLDSGIDDNGEPLLITKAELLDPDLKAPQMVVTKEALGPELVSHFIDLQDEPQDNQGDAEQFVDVEAQGHGKAQQVLLSTETKRYDIGELVSSKNRAMEIIAQENMPIPPELKDEEAPILPMDVSAISRDELFSLHAKFHACESRMLWILCQEEDKYGDIEKLRKNREAVVAASIPFLGEDGKRNTNEYRDAQVAADEEVLSLGLEEHELKKVVKRLKILCDMYHRSCERLSRQMSKYERERADAPS